MKELADRLGAKLVVGQYVIAMRKNYRELVNAQIIGLTAQKVRVTYRSHWNSQYMDEYLTLPNDVIVWPNQTDPNFWGTKVPLEKIPDRGTV